MYVWIKWGGSLKYTLPDLRSSYVPEGPAHFGTEYTCGKLHVYVQGSLNWNTKWNTLECDRPQHGHPASCIIAQHYSSATFVSLHFRSRKEELARLKNVSISFF
jgi:hypothetical protein